MPKYRIRQNGVNSFDIQQKVLWFWMDCTEYGHYSLEEARNCIAKWEADEAVRGTIHDVSPPSNTTHDG